MGEVSFLIFEIVGWSIVGFGGRMYIGYIFSSKIKKKMLSPRSNKNKSVDQCFINIKSEKNFWDRIRSPSPMMSHVMPGEKSLSDDDLYVNPFESVQVNGRRILHLLPNWESPIPTNECELFIKKIPRSWTEYSLLPQFQRFGAVYEVRLMMDFNELNRGYGFVKYTNERDAARALEVLNHYFVEPGKLLDVQRSFDKCRLFVSNIPKELSEQELNYEFRQMFPSLDRVITHKRISDRNFNRGFVFLDFPNHQEALNVKKQMTPGRLRKWDSDLKIVWANPERNVNPESLENIKTLFVRNVDLSVNDRDLYAVISTQTNIKNVAKISRVREFAFIEFKNREAAEKILNTLHGVVLKGYPLAIEWAIPACSTSVHSLQNNDYDAVLRLKCISNYWSVPVIVFGRIFIAEQVQYVAIMIREKNMPRVFFMEIDGVKLVDIQSRACEVLVTLIERSGELPKHNYILKIKNDMAYIVGAIIDLETATFVKAYNITSDLFMYWNEIRDLSNSIHSLCEYTDTQIIDMYTNNLLKTNNPNILNGIFVRDRLFGCISPLYRNKPPLKYNLNNTQVILSLIHVSSYTNVLFPYDDILYNFKDSSYEIQYSAIEFSSLALLPLHFAQSSNAQTQMNYILFAPSTTNVDGIVQPLPVQKNCLNSNSRIHDDHIR